RVSAARPRPPPSAWPSTREAAPRRAARTPGPRPCRATPARLPCSVCTPAGARQTAPRPRGRARTAPRRPRAHPTRRARRAARGGRWARSRPTPFRGVGDLVEEQTKPAHARQHARLHCAEWRPRTLRDLRLGVAGVVGQDDRFPLRWRQRRQRRAYPFAAKPGPGRVLDRRQVARAGRGVVVRLLGQAGPPRAHRLLPAYRIYGLVVG